MEAIQVKCRNRKPRVQSTVTIKTNLYELMETVLDVVGPDENRLINEVTLNLLAKANPKVSVLDN
jgi:hypothetical protein